MGEQGPHVCAVAEAAYRRTEGDQSILVRGDIGAGETEITKMLVRYLAHLGGPSGRTLEQQIQKSNPILEAFGHAKTDTNSNSRRFSKSVELQFDNDRRISGAAVRTYLLETSRVCGFFDGTRNYNCFYQLCATSKYIEKHKLKKGFHYLDNYSCHESDGEEYNATIKAMEVVGISSEEQDAIFQVLAAILHLGNVDFVRVENASSAKFHLERAAAFFGCDVNDLKDSLSKQVICGVTERWDHAVAVALRDSFAKEVYSRLFEWLVEKINSSIGHDKDRDQNTLIRVVEINGYQNFKTNRFEQLCINFTNDMLEKHFDQNLCECQVPCKEIPYVFGYLNERAPGRDYFTDNLYDDSKSEFTITHYNGDIVTYQSDIFFAENHDYIVPQHQTLLSKSTSSFIRGLFPLPEGSSQSQRSSAGSHLIEQLQSLMKALDSTQLYYLTYNSVRQGVMGKIEIRWAGDPTIQTLDEFLHCFRILSLEVLDGNHDKKNVVREILKKVGIDRGYLIWETKVYLQARQLGILYCRKHEKLNNAANIIQRKFRSYIPRKRFLRLRNVAIQLQSSCRGALERKHYNQMRREFIEKACKQAAKSQFALEEMQAQLREAHDHLAKEREATKEAMEQAAKSQFSLEEMQARLTEAHDHLLKEQEATKEAMEQGTLMTKRVEEIETKLEQLTKNNQDLGRIDLVQTDLVQTLDRPIDVSPIKEPPNDRNEMDTLINCVSQDIGFSHETPVAASIIYKSFFHWRSFEAETTSVFDRIIQMIGSAIETEESNVVLAYWLSNTSTLLLLLKRTLKTSAATAMLPQRRRTSTNLLGKMAQGFRTSPSTMAPPPPSPISQVEGKYPALLFMQQLTAYVDKIYGMVRDTLKKDISLLLALCIQAPRTLRASSVKDSSRSHANATAVQAIIGNWSSIVKSLNNSLKTMRANYVLPFLVRKIFTQMFAFINVQLFNSLLLRRECCSFSNGENVKSGLAELEHWCSEATEEYVGCAWDELKHIRQAVAFLVMHQKQKKTLDEITHDLCPVLSIQQLYRISTLYWDDKYGTHSVSPDVISNMRVLMTEDSNNALSNSFLLDDDKSIPFSVDDIAKSMNQVDLSNIDAPCQLLENSNFHFLLPRHGLLEPEE